MTEKLSDPFNVSKIELPVVEIVLPSPYAPCKLVLPPPPPEVSLAQIKFPLESVVSFPELVKVEQLKFESFIFPEEPLVKVRLVLVLLLPILILVVCVPPMEIAPALPVALPESIEILQELEAEPDAVPVSMVIPPELVTPAD